MIVLTFIFFESELLGQTDFGVFFNSNHSGRNIALSISKTIDNMHTIGGGVRYNINRLALPDDQFKTYYKRLYATEPIHYFGLIGFYQRRIFNNLKSFEPFLFYNIQMTYSSTRNRSFLPKYEGMNGETLYVEAINNFGPFTWLEQNLGIGFSVNIFSNWYFQQKIGFGTSFIMGYDEVITAKAYEWFHWEFGYLFSFGMIYRF